MSKKSKPKKEFDIWGENKKYPRVDWKYEVCNGDTNLGYWEWVNHNKEVENYV